MASKHHLGNSNKKHSGNDPKYMQNDTGPTQAAQKALKNVGGTHPPRKVGEK